MKTFDDIKDFLRPPDAVMAGLDREYQANHFFSRIQLMPDDLPEIPIGKQGVAILGVMEARGRYSFSEIDLTPDLIRSRLFGLFAQPESPLMVDIGNIQPGHTLQDTNFAVSGVLSFMIKKGWTVIILGGSNDLTLGVYQAYEKLEQLVNLACIDARIDLGEGIACLPSETFLSSIILHQPNYLFNLSLIGYQSYLVDPELLKLFEKLFFDAYRLGEIRGNVGFAEPLLRSADIVSIDFSAIKSSEVPGLSSCTPNGLSADEICQLSKYCGASEKVSVFGIFDAINYESENDNSLMLAAQMIWSFMEGFNLRSGEMPGEQHADFLKYRVSLLNSSHELIFFKSQKTDRWWMQVPYPLDKRSRYERQHLVACSYHDYLQATSQIMPDRWWQTFQKLI